MNRRLKKLVRNQQKLLSAASRDYENLDSEDDQADQLLSLRRGRPRGKKPPGIKETKSRGLTQPYVSATSDAATGGNSDHSYRSVGPMLHLLLLLSAASTGSSSAYHSPY